jgi:hypothetical protein
MQINIEEHPIPISQQFAQILETEIKKSGEDPKHGIVINFRDPDYSAETGGYHPVEVMVSASGHIQYVTDFSYCGGPFPELVKELDWDMISGVFGHMGMRDHPIEQGVPLYRMFEDNFISYYQSGVFTVSISSLG